MLTPYSQYVKTRVFTGHSEITSIEKYLVFGIRFWAISPHLQYINSEKNTSKSYS